MRQFHYTDVIMTTIASQITSLTVVYLAVYSGADQRKHQSSASLAFVQGIHRDRWIPPQMASNAENVSIWWRHHVVFEEDLSSHTATTQQEHWLKFDLPKYTLQCRTIGPFWQSDFISSVCFCLLHVWQQKHKTWITNSLATVPCVKYVGWKKEVTVSTFLAF